MCAICNHRPRANGGRYCANCQAKIDSEKQRRAAEKPIKYATYRGHVVGFHRRNGKLVPRLLRRKPEGLPKGKTLDLNSYIEGFTRDQVKNLKSAILKLAES
jgi:hypothetical protein